MISPVIAAKEHQDLPDNYGMKVTYITGKIENIDCASHKLVDKISHTRKESLVNNGVEDKNNFKWIEYTESIPVPFFEIWTKDNEMVLIPLASIQNIHFDKNFSKVVEINTQLKAKNDKANTI